MALTYSSMMALGSAAPDFNLPDSVSGKSFALNDIQGRHATLVMFICNHCPFVIHIQDELVRLGKDYQDQGVGIVAISANDAKNYPDDSPENMKKLAERLGITFPYLFDETQATARAYDAVCTPDFFIFDAELKCAYRGQLDDSRPNNGIPVTGSDIRRALNLLISNQPVPTDDQKPSMGCSIKWK